MAGNPRSIVIAERRRAISTTPLRKFADVDESLDPRLQFRESDEVDVCIVGGGQPRSLVRKEIRR